MTVARIELSKFDGSVAGVRRVLNEIVALAADGRINPKDAQIIVAAAKIELAGIRTEFEQSELLQLKDLVAKAEVLAQRGRSQEVADRHHQKLLTSGK